MDFNNNASDKKKYRIIKISLNQIFKEDKYRSILNDAICRTNSIVIHTYHFLRLWVLKKFEEKQIIPKITKDFVGMCFKTLTYNQKNQKGPKPKGENLNIFKEFMVFNDQIYTKLYFTNISGRNLSAIFNYLETEIVTNIENNIKQNFFKYINQFVNQMLKTYKDAAIDLPFPKLKKQNQETVRKELKQIKEDLKNNTLKSHSRHHKWIIKWRKIILPQEFNKSFAYDIKVNPQKYLKHMIIMNNYLKIMNCKQFQFFPLRTSAIPKYCSFDTKSLVELFILKNKNNYLCDIQNKRVEIWNQFFEMDHKIFKSKKYVFDYDISTDGFSCSLRFIHKDFLDEQIEQKTKIKDSRNKNKLYKSLTNEQKIIQTEIDKKNKYREKLPQKKTEKIDHIPIEFPYLDDLDDKKLDELKNSFLIYVDPGKSNLLMMMGENGKFLRYTNPQKLNETKQKIYAKMKENFTKANESAKQKIEYLSTLNSKSCNFKEFETYVSYKNFANSDVLFKHFNSNIFRKLRWYYFINKKRSIDNLINRIEKTYMKRTFNKKGKKNRKIINKKEKSKLKLIYGDWDQKNQLRNFISTPQIGLKRKLAERFEIINFDEFRTSKLHHKTNEICKNPKKKNSKGKFQKIHSVLTFQMNTNRIGYIQRDKNAVLNFQKLTKEYLTNKTRATVFCGGNKLIDTYKKEFIPEFRVLKFSE